MDPIKLYGMPASLYTGKVRSYLRMQRIPFVEYGMNHPDFYGRIVPEVGRPIVPVVELPDGTIIQDGADILDYFEQSDLSRFSIYPVDPTLQVVTHLLELFGGEGLLRPAMHYRWNFDEYHAEFLKDEFTSALVALDGDDAEADKMFEFASDRMRKAAAGFGVTAESAPLIEDSYRELLGLLNNHFKRYPFMLGGRPTIGDYGLVAALYAHLARDPVPAQLMRRVAPRVGRWVERMNSPESVWVEHEEDESLIAAHSIPESLIAVLRYFAKEYLPELLAHFEYANSWLKERSSLRPGTNGLEKPGTRFIGTCAFPWRGITLETVVMPYRFYLHQRCVKCHLESPKSSQSATRAVLREVGLETVLDLATLRPVQRVNHLEVWGETHDETVRRSGQQEGSVV